MALAIPQICMKSSNIFNGPFGPGAADPKNYDFRKNHDFRNFHKKSIFLIFSRFFWSGSGQGNLGELEKSKNMFFFLPKIYIFMLEVIRLYSIIGTRQSSRLKGKAARNRSILGGSLFFEVLRPSGCRVMNELLICLFFCSAQPLCFMVFFVDHVFRENSLGNLSQPVFHRKTERRAKIRYR